MDFDGTKFIRSTAIRTIHISEDVRQLCVTQALFLAPKFLATPSRVYCSRETFSRPSRREYDSRRHSRSFSGLNTPSMAVTVQLRIDDAPVAQLDRALASGANR